MEDKGYEVRATLRSFAILVALVTTMVAIIIIIVCYRFLLPLIWSVITDIIH